MSLLSIGKRYRACCGLPVVGLVVAFWLSGMASRADAQDLKAVVDDFWAAGSTSEIEQAVQAVLALEPDIESLWPLVRAGATYAADVPRGRQLLTRDNGDGVEYRYIAYIPEDYDPTRRYPVRVYLHGGVSRPRRDEANWWRNQERYTRADAIVVFPESWREAMWWQANQVENLEGLLNDLKRDYNVNENAVHLLGVSDGATGVFYHAFKAPTPWAGFLSFNGHPVVLANPATDADGQMYVTNLRNKPFFVINGGQDRLYPVESVVPFLQLFADAGVFLDFRPKPEGGHNMQWWDEETANIDTFIGSQPRRPLPDRVVWETESSDLFNRAHWLVITELGNVDGETSFDDFNQITPPAARAPIGFNRLGELEAGVGVLLIDILAGSIAEAAGVRAGDVLVETNDISVATVDDLRVAIQAPRDAPGLSVKVERDGEPLSFVLMPPARTDSPPPRQAFPLPVASGRVQLLRDGNDIAVVTRGVRRYKLLLSPEQFDFTTPFRVVTNDVESFAGAIEPSPQTLLRWAARDRDRTMLFGAELDVEVVAPN
ncbi:MAG: PDZ domain-containing protein [Acidobacteriota bacterium]|nr:PDZ domain-containing protein [Acidobacteriota bacterium]